MKTTIIRYGLYGAALQIVFFIIYWLILRVQITPENYNTQEITGYLEILASLCFVYFGIRYYRDQVNGHIITFGKALGIGLLISLIPAIAFGLLDQLYTKMVDPHFLEKWTNIQVEQLRKSTPPAEFPAKVKALKAEIETYSNPFIGWLVMFLTVFFIGVIVSAVSALILKRKTIKPNA
ncbi:DUF4199 domain-containing protein [Mucilaginibacter mali]|uniref:DUF4199 domain-containing protein n=1 Tax=Mucilaginibacter mali TaxID=2740462 RepID=A0A7D4ULW9_9SPHI|nr:DUF4199 domain-containing protein [Mucilaginibacter mali]QKJ30481.1 DUF4199 domain-containing protein [Mucilaginibacter mali]